MPSPNGNACVKKLDHCTFGIELQPTDAFGNPYLRK